MLYLNFLRTTFEQASRLSHMAPARRLEPGPRARPPLLLYFAEHMGHFYSFLFPWNFMIQGIAIVHFIRRRPDTYWLWIILIGGGLGAIVYIFVEVLPDFGLLRQSF